MWVDFTSPKFLQLRVLKIEHVFAQVLRKYRLESGMSQHELAYEANINRNNVSLYETGARLPTLATLFMLCNAMDVPPEEFIKEVAAYNPEL